MPGGRSPALPQRVDVDPARAVNYDHRFHAGNFADVLKHVVLTRVLLYLQRKPAPYRVIDTHAGRGSYDLETEAAARTLEWQSGVGRFDRAALPPAARDLVAPYLDAVGEAVRGAAAYPGSPALALRLSRPCDRMIFCELHPAAAAELRARVGGDRRAKVIARDGFVGLKAFIPPVERRGLVLVDPPFEAADEFGRLAEALRAGHAKWRDGIFMLWYPVKDRRGIELLSSKVVQAGISDVLRLELDVDRPSSDGQLAANGLLIVNPPYTLEAEMSCVLPELRKLLGGERGAWRIDRLAA